MKKVFFIVTVLLTVLNVNCFAASQFGYVDPEAGKTGIGVEYFHLREEMKPKSSDFEEIEIIQNHFAITSSYSFNDRISIGAKAGVADMEVEDTFGNDNFNDSFAPFGSISLKTMIYKKNWFSVGAFAQGSYYSKYTDERSTGSNWRATPTTSNTYSAACAPPPPCECPDCNCPECPECPDCNCECNCPEPEPVECPECEEQTPILTGVNNQGFERVTITDRWDANIGLSLQAEVDRFMLYAGPMLYFARAKVTIDEFNSSSNPYYAESNYDSYSTSYREKHCIGAFAGASANLGNNFYLQIEGQYRSTPSFGAALTKTF